MNTWNYWNIYFLFYFFIFFILLLLISLIFLLLQPHRNAVIADYARRIASISKSLESEMDVLASRDNVRKIKLLFYFIWQAYSFVFRLSFFFSFFSFSKKNSRLKLHWYFSQLEMTLYFYLEVKVSTFYLIGFFFFLSSILLNNTFFFLIL